MKNYLDDLFTPSVLAVQHRKGSSGIHSIGLAGPDGLDRNEIAHITARDSFYLATISESGWPYAQHRGGDAGFVKVLGPTTIGWAERSGNRQYLGTGNILADKRVSAIFVDYPNRTRLKLRGHATYHPEPSAALVDELDASGMRVDGAVTLEVVASEWNCPKYITPRYTQAQIEAAAEPLRQRIRELEGQLSSLLLRDEGGDEAHLD